MYSERVQLVVFFFLSFFANTSLFKGISTLEWQFGNEISLMYKAI